LIKKKEVDNIMKKQKTDKMKVMKMGKCICSTYVDPTIDIECGFSNVCKTPCDWALRTAKRRFTTTLER